MRSRHLFHAVDSHTEGMPTRVVTGGVGVVPGDTMAARRTYFRTHLDHVRTLLIQEPRGHSAMFGAVLQPPTRPDADYGVLFAGGSGYPPMCGHGAIGVATVLVETGMVAVAAPVTTVRLDTPAGLVVAQVAVRADGAATAVTIRNVPAFVVALDATVDVPGIGPVRYDLAYGGNFYAIVDLAQLGLAFDPAVASKLIEVGLSIMEAVNTAARPVHGEDPDIAGCRHVYLSAPGSNATLSRHAMAIHPGYLDRSPCGTGTSARMAQLWARGELPLGRDFANESLLGRRLVGRLVEQVTVAGQPAAVSTVTGRAWVTGTAQYLLDPEDPFPAGFRL
ncbi:MAG TPA: proline racemase family protein [Micromonosporaceae bacterium]|nr:proline racemase family protein [Micromonosporaceae bacterium]